MKKLCDESNLSSRQIYLTFLEHCIRASGRKWPPVDHYQRHRHRRSLRLLHDDDGRRQCRRHSCRNRRHYRRQSIVLKAYESATVVVVESNKWHHRVKCRRHHFEIVRFSCKITIISLQLCAAALKQPNR